MIALRRSRGSSDRKARRQASSPRVPHGLLTGKELDPDFVDFNSVNRRYHFPHRAYQPFKGAFIQTDPLIRMIEARLFAATGRPQPSFAMQAPLFGVDPTGLFTVASDSGCGCCCCAEDVHIAKDKRGKSAAVGEIYWEDLLGSIVSFLLTYSYHPGPDSDCTLQWWEYSTHRPTGFAKEDFVENDWNDMRRVANRGKHPTLTRIFKPWDDRDTTCDGQPRSIYLTDTPFVGSAVYILRELHVALVLWSGAFCPRPKPCMNKYVMEVFTQIIDNRQLGPVSPPPPPTIEFKEGKQHVPADRMAKLKDKAGLD